MTNLNLQSPSSMTMREGEQIQRERERERERELSKSPKCFQLFLYNFSLTTENFFYCLTFSDAQNILCKQALHFPIQKKKKKSLHFVPWSLLLYKE